jgi:hypothetical protein
MRKLLTIFENNFLIVALAICALLPLSGAGKCGGSSPGQATCQTACANLATLTCAEGIDTTCETTCQNATTQGIADLNLPCLTSATSVAAVQACGTVNCTASPGAKIPATCANACAVVQRLRCPEGPSCLAECQKAQGKVVDLKLSCLVAAKTVAQLQACGTVACK